jgi:hypothetical protein
MGSSSLISPVIVVASLHLFFYLPTQSCPLTVRLKSAARSSKLVETVKKLKEMSKVTSGALASESMYQFTPEMHALVKTRKEQAMALGAGDADEESLLPKQKEELAAELVRRRNRRDTTVGTTTTLNNIL